MWRGVHGLVKHRVLDTHMPALQSFTHHSNTTQSTKVHDSRPTASSTHTPVQNLLPAVICLAAAVDRSLSRR